MQLSIQILVGLLTFICIAGGMNLLLKGVASFLPKGAKSPPVLDNLFRFLSGIYFGLGFMMAWVCFHLETVGNLVYFIGFVVLCSGLGRLYSRMKLGSAGNYLFFIMIFEIVLGILIMVLQFLK
ncbi:MAG: DUF4345 domain-containing protein [Bacteroidetes bacterium]|nr:DUF4345 domain-containing protein [Bacteroidota bacterium]